MIYWIYITSGRRPRVILIQYITRDYHNHKWYFPISNTSHYLLTLNYRKGYDQNQEKITTGSSLSYTNFVSKVVRVSRISCNSLGMDFSLSKHKLNPTVLYNKYKPSLKWNDTSWYIHKYFAFTSLPNYLLNMYQAANTYSTSIHRFTKILLKRKFIWKFQF